MGLPEDLSTRRTYDSSDRNRVPSFDRFPWLRNPRMRGPGRGCDQARKTRVRDGDLTGRLPEDLAWRAIGVIMCHIGLEP